MTTSLTDTLDRIACNAVLGIMLAAIPLAGLTFLTNTMGI